VTRLVVLETVVDSDAKVLAEVRQLDDRFLLSPWARRVAKVYLVPAHDDSDVSAPKGSERGRSGALKVINGAT